MDALKKYAVDFKHVEILHRETSCVIRVSAAGGFQCGHVYVFVCVKAKMLVQLSYSNFTPIKI